MILKRIRNATVLIYLCRWFVDTSRHIAKHRIAKRHLNAGIEHTQRAAEERAEENDLPNGDLIRAKLVMPDVVIVND